MSIPRHCRALLVVLSAALVVIPVLGLPSAAYATAQGTPGKIVYTDIVNDAIKVWDPGTEQTTALVSGVLCPYATNGTGICAGDNGISAPLVSWSPDGTKIAYSRWLPDGTSSVYDQPRMHSAIFVMNADGSDQHQVSHPPAAVNSQCNLDVDAPCDGASFSDFGPTWSPNGATLAFIRAANIARDRSDARIGSQVWTMSSAGGGETQLTHVPMPSDVTGNMWEDDGRPLAGYQSVAWSPSGTHLAAYRTKVDDDPELDLLSTSGGSGSALVDGYVDDYDWSPDGSKLAYVAEGSFEVTVRSLSGGTQDGGPADSAAVRYGPDGNGPVAMHLSTCTSVADCGLFEHLLPDPGSNLRVDDPDRAVAAGGGVPVAATDDYGRAPWDIQAQDLPIVFLPGFLGSEIEGCSGETLWPPGAWPPTNGTHLQNMRLDGAGCADAHPTGKALGSVLGKDIYDGVQDWLDANAPGGDQVASVVYGWDWRRSPDAAMVGLNTAIDDALNQDLPKRQGADRVVFLAHSYGGLLGKWYTAQSQANADKVARVLTMGTPWWGSPKVLMPLAFGIESPLNEPGMDLVLPNDDLQAFARSLAGLFELFPSAHFGPWLVSGGKVQDSAGVRATVRALGGDPALYDAAQQHHGTTYDGFDDNNGKTDVQAVVGTGLPTFRSVILNSASTIVGWANGDGTVPLTSAQQGTDPDHPLGDRVHVQAVCGVSHVDLANSPKVLEPYKDFLLYGRTPRKTEGACPDNGAQMEIFDLHVAVPDQPVPDQLTPRRAARSTAAAAGGALSLADAFQRSRIDLLDLPDRTTVVTNALDPVALRFTGNATRFVYTPIAGGRTGKPVEYGPVSGDIVVEAASGGTPRVTADGVVVTPHGATGSHHQPPASPPRAARLGIARSAIKHHRLRLGITVGPAAIGSKITVAAKHLRLSVPVRSTRVKINRRLTGKLAKARTLKVRVGVVAGAKVRAASARVLAAAHPSHLKITRQARVHGRMKLAGRIAKRARHRVLVDAIWTDSDGRLGSWHGTARIRKGHWKTKAVLPAAAYADGELTVRYPGDARHHLAGRQIARSL